MPQYLIKRKKTYFVRIAVPRPLWELVGSKEIQRTTGTSDLKLAERRKHAIVAAIRDEIDEKANDSPASAGWLHKQALGLRRAVQRGDIDQQLASEIISDLQEKHLNAVGTSKDAPFVPDHLVTRLVTAHRYATDPEYQPLSGLIEQYLEERKPAVQPSTYARKGGMLSEFKEWLQDDPDVNEITRKVTGRYVSAVLVGNGKHPKTNRDTITGLSGFFNWMIRRGAYDHANPWTGLGQTINGSTRGSAKLQPRRWTDKELKALFKSIPAGPQYYLREMCAIAAYTGMRQNEIAELEVTDIDLKAKTIHISEGKTQSSVRTVPIHSKLLPVIKQLVGKRTDGYLFENFKPAGRDKKRGHEFSKRFGYWRNQRFPDTVHTDTATGHTRSEVNFHSFRRSFINACELAGIPEPTTKQIVGHAKSSLTYGTYSTGVDMKLLREAVEKVDYSGVEL